MNNSTALKKKRYFFLAQAQITPNPTDSSNIQEIMLSSQTVKPSSFYSLLENGVSHCDSCCSLDHSQVSLLVCFSH